MAALRVVGQVSGAYRLRAVRRAVRQHLPDAVGHPALPRFNVQAGWQSGVAMYSADSRGHMGAGPHAGFWVLLGGPKVPPRRVLRKRTVRRIRTRIARNGRTTITSVLWTFFQPHLSLKRKVPLTVLKKLCGGPVPSRPKSRLRRLASKRVCGRSLHPPSAAQGDCGPPNAPSNPLGDGGRRFCAFGRGTEAVRRGLGGVGYTRFPEP